MRAVRWQRAGDVALVVVLAVMTESLAWGGPGAGDPLTGPRVLAATLPLLLDLPLLWRRSHPLAVLLLVVTGAAGHALVSGRASEGLHIVIPLTLAGYAVARHAAPRRAEVGLAVLVGGYLLYLTQDHNVRYGDVGERWAAAFFAAVLVVAWGAGLFVRTRHVARAEQERIRAAEQWAADAVAAERGRVARELHDIVSHNLSVVVLQASGARAQPDSDPALETIESSARKALNEMRSMLGVLRSSEEEPLAPLPGLTDLPALVEGIRAAGLPVELSGAASCEDLPPGLQLSVYRIVQESLTNALKHSRASQCEVRLSRTGDLVTVDVVDDGPASADEPGLGHGLIGMRERCVLAGGRLDAGHDGSGFRVHAEAAGAVVTRVLLADDQELVREGLRRVLEATPGFEVVGEAGNGRDAVTAVRSLDPDVVLMDIRMPVLDGIEATRQVVAAGVRTRVLVLTTFDLDEYVYAALKAGASGFLLKDATREQLVAGIIAVVSGESLLAPAVTRRLIEDFCSRPAPGASDTPLTARELDVVRALSKGLSNAEIAGELFLGETTVKSHIARALDKLQLRDRVQLVVYAYENGLT